MTESEGASGGAGIREARGRRTAAGGSGRSRPCTAELRRVSGLAGSCRKVRRDSERHASAAPQKLRRFECFGSPGKRPLGSGLQGTQPGPGALFRVVPAVPGNEGRTLPAQSWGEKAERIWRDFRCWPRSAPHPAPARRRPHSGTRPGSAAQQPLQELWRRLAAASCPGSSSGPGGRRRWVTGWRLENRACGTSRRCKAEGSSAWFFGFYQIHVLLNLVVAPSGLRIVHTFYPAARFIPDLGSPFKAAAPHPAAPPAGEKNHRTASHLALTRAWMPRFLPEGHTAWQSPAGPAAPHSELSLRPPARKAGWSARRRHPRLFSPTPLVLRLARITKGKDHTGRGAVLHWLTALLSFSGFAKPKREG